MTHVTLSCGLELDIDELKLDDMTFYDLVAEADSDGPRGISRFASYLLGETQKNALYAALRCTNDGRVPVKALTDACIEAIRALNGGGKA